MSENDRKLLADVLMIARGIFEDTSTATLDDLRPALDRYDLRATERLA